MEAHVHLNLGVYFDDVTLTNQLVVASSRTIPDLYWNYAYMADGSSFDKTSLLSATAALRAVGRDPVVFQLAEAPLPEGWTVRSEETWMWIDRTAARSLQVTERQPSRLQIRDLSTPTPEMRAVFEDAYSSGSASESEEGYFQLPLAYGEAYSHSAIHPPALQRHFAGWIDGECVVIASVSVWMGMGGLYSVGTRHDARRRGYGRELSRLATQWAMEHGAKGVLLQTTADSAVELMYRELGYSRTHLGVLAAPEDSP